MATVFISKELTDREIQEGIYRNIKQIQSYLNFIHGMFVLSLVLSALALLGFIIGNL